MPILQWSERFSVSIPKVDAEHQKLVEMINLLYDSMKVGKGSDVLGKILNDITEYSVKHFQTEETLMVQHQYPGYKEHKAAHEEFAKTVNLLVSQYKDKRLPASQLLKVLQDWLVNHITVTDKAYTPYLMEKMKS